MYLKSIEVHGFKSFANKTVFEFHNGITAIVGPNGSGKSNVADAVRWVLGEQKVKQLRSTSMQDVIFAGTQNRKPVSYAWAAITLDNSDHALALDYTEVTVARRVYRSGESEYLLNGSACRLRDIQELFYDTGIGKEGYSIIGQGQIDKILSGRPEDRRELFDEAAGIVKYKRRRQMAEKKLENERQNLARIRDILSELEKQLGPLGRQSETARIYLTKRDELRKLEVNRFLAETEDVRARREKLQTDLSNAQEEQAQAQTEAEQIRGGYEETEKQTESLEAEIEHLRAECSRTDVLREKLEGQLALLSEQVRTAQANTQMQSHRLSIIADDIARCQSECGEYEEKKKGFADEIEAAAQRKSRQYERMAQIRNKIAECESLIDDCKEEIIEILNRRIGRQGDGTRLDTLLEQAQGRQKELEENTSRQEDTRAQLAADLENAGAELEEISERLRTLSGQEEKIGKKLDGWREKSDETTRALEHAKNNYHKDASRLESLRNIAERYDGYGSSIRRVMEQRERIPGICGVVADILKVEKQYETAIETALGGSIQNIVTEDEETAKRLISYLKEHRYGRATFLPLTSVKRRDGKVREDVLSGDGVIGFADRLVQTQPRYRGIAENLLGRTLVIDDIDHAAALQRKYHYSLRIVTLEGELLQPGGSMTGGAFKNSSSLLGRNREIGLLSKQVRQEKEVLETSQERLEEIRTARELLKEDLASVRGEIQELRLKQNTVQMKLEHGQEEEQAQKELAISAQREKETIAAEIRGIESERIELLKKAEADTRREEELRTLSDEQQEILEEQNEAYRKEQNRQSDILMEEAAVRQKEDFLNENIARVLAEIEKLTAEREEICRSFGESEAEITQKQEQIREFKRQIGTAQQETEEQKRQIAQLQEKREELSAGHRAYFERREEISGQINVLDKEIFRLTSQLEKLEETMESQTAHLWEEYELTPHAAKQYSDPDLGSIAVMKKRIAAIREEIKGLGNVNVNAIEEYRSVSERFEFLDSQRSDIEKSEEALVEIIADLEDGMRQQFNEKFAEIQLEFDRVFRELFGGGKGTLALTDGEDILGSGVQIIAQPPGKKLQNMMQLSGGEKALTAIALLFAIQNLKPSPFCLLDEIEAALDDANVTRFAAYLKKLSKNTQFILITHRRGTMLAADRLYGITMQEKGVSTQVSVDLIEKQLDD